MKIRYLIFMICLSAGLELSSQVRDTSAISFFDSRWHVDFRIGYSTNFVNQKTQHYLDHYGSLGFGTSLYYRNISFYYFFNPATILRVKHPFNDQSGDTVRKYANTFWKTEGPYSINIIKHHFGIGYEKRISMKSSITPAIGISLCGITVKDSANYQKRLPQFYDFNFGLSYRRYIVVSKGGSFFYGIQGNTGFSNISDTFSGFGNAYWTITISCGAKIVPKGFILNSVLMGLTKR